MKAVIKLQQLATNPDIKVSELLNHAYLISSKLDVKQFSDWCNNELNGYFSNNDDIPNYRLIRGSIYASAVGKATIPVVISGPEWAKYTDMKLIHDPIPKLESWIYSDDKPFINLRLEQGLEERLLRFFDDQDNQLIQKMGMQNNPFSDNLRSGYQPFLSISKTDISNILSTIRKAILDWSINLEKQGIIGEDYIFTAEEKQMTHNVNYHIGSVGSIANHNENSTINQSSTNTVQIIKGDFNSLASKLKDYGVEEADIQELKNVIDITPSPQSPTEYNEGVNSWIGKITVKALSESWQVTKDVGVAVFADLIKIYYGI
ncbi:MAG: hypothetical protein PHG15_10845 [Acinetobacter sp.]|uniref:AbiTii domain-containing protein n=1 Tax=Acinetobacter sp. TaxID=472 RepID=UPI00260D5FB5|nr:hypothetical protein [Acinetobacter sp.]MDD2946261.1 hypothetical protein [Acinetobacter sp.]